ncbi:hypothetical protein ACFTSF_11005 [Kribbella sp. NPDC056951]|uniref:hypothetical protein n=1 Tax=Kribbella sp. NPDC056951 TaxID=3345978 RepID=UPI00363A271B
MRDSGRTFWIRFGYGLVALLCLLAVVGLFVFGIDWVGVGQHYSAACLLAIIAGAGIASGLGLRCLGAAVKYRGVDMGWPFSAIPTRHRIVEQ